MPGRVPFPEPLVVAVNKGGYKTRPFTLRAPFSYRRQSGEQITVPEGYSTDFASVPRFFHRLLPPVGNYSYAAVVHDWLCDQPVKSRGYRQAAKVFREAMEDCGVSAPVRAAMYRAVLWFGPKFEPGKRKII